jgi:uncharacterized repeat protein (TIGR01451 family)
MARKSSSAFGSSGLASSLRSLLARLWKRPEMKEVSKRTRRRMFMEPLEGRAVMASDLGAITGLVFVDTAGDGFDLGEEVAGATVELFLDDGDSVFEPGAGDALVTSDTTDSNGEYQFLGLAAGSYWVRQPAQVIGADSLILDVQEVVISATDEEGILGSLIDDFSSAVPTAVAADPLGTTDSDTADLLATEVLGLERDFEVELTGTSGGQSVQMTVAADKLSLNPSIQAQGRYTAVWDGDDNDGSTAGSGIDFDGLAGYDLTDLGSSAGIILEDVLADQAGGSATIRVYTDATNFSTLTMAIPNSVNTDLFFDFADFTTAGGTGADFTDVGAIELEINSTVDAMDGEVEYISAIGYTFQQADFDNFVESDLELSKVVDVAAPNVGDDVTFTITVTNGGPDSAMNVAVTDLLPAGLTFVSSNPSQGAYVSGTGIWTVGTILSGADATLDIVATVTTLGAKTNVAEVTASDSADTDSTPDNSDTAPNEDDTDSVVVTPLSIDLALTKAASAANVNVGSNVTFTLTVANTGTNNATGVVVTDLLPAGLTFVSSNPSQGAYVSGTGIWTVGAINTGANATLEIVATKTQTGTITNIAEVTDADQADADSTPNNAAVGEDDRDTEAVADLTIDLALTKTVNNATQNVGQNVTFTVTVTNTGTGNASGVEVTDLLPAGLTFVSSNPSLGTYTSGTGVWTVGAVNTGDSETLEIVATVASVGAKINAAEVTAADQTDVDSTPDNQGTAPNEDDTATATVTPPTIDLSIDKTVNNASPNVGQQVTFTIVVSNAAAQSNATNVAVTDLLPAGMTFVSSNPSQGTYASGTGIWTVGTINTGASATLTITATVASVGAKTNFAEVTAADQSDADSTPDNRVAQPLEDDTDSVIVTPQSIDLSLTKTVNGAATATPNKNQNVTYLITISNAAGQSNATNVVVTDLLPAGMTFVSSTPSQGTYTSATGVWTVGTVNAGANATLSVVATATTTGAKVNNAEVTAADQADIDSTPGNRSTAPSEDDTATATVTPAVADLSLTKTVDIAAPNSNQNVVFTITLTNGGPATATGISVTDLLPTGLTFVSSNPSTGTYNQTTGVWTVASLNSAANATLTITATPTTSGAKVNTAEITAAEQFDSDSTPGNRATAPSEDDTASVTVTPNATDLALTKTIDDSSPEIGQNVTFTVTVSNQSAVNATNVVVTDLLPAGFTFVSSTPSQGTYVSGTGVWTVGAINANGSATLTIVATVNSNGNRTNTASITSLDQFDTDSTPGNNTAGEDDQGSITVQPFVLSKRLCVVR